MLKVCGDKFKIFQFDVDHRGEGGLASTNQGGIDAPDVISSCGQSLYGMKRNTACHKSVCVSSSSPLSCHGSCIHFKRGTDLRVTEWGGCRETGFVYTKISQVVIRIVGSTVIPTDSRFVYCECTHTKTNVITSVNSNCIEQLNWIIKLINQHLINI